MGIEGMLDNRVPEAVNKHKGISSGREVRIVRMWHST